MPGRIVHLSTQLTPPERLTLIQSHYFFLLMGGEPGAVEVPTATAPGSLFRRDLIGPYAGAFPLLTVGPPAGERRVSLRRLRPGASDGLDRDRVRHLSGGVIHVARVDRGESVPRGQTLIGCARIEVSRVFDRTLRR